MTSIQNDSGESLRLDVVERAVDSVCDSYDLVGEVSLLIAPNNRLKALNLQFRGLDEPTDVLTFPAPETAQGQLGDIAISIDFARDQAKLRGVPIEDEIAMLAIHGCLHLAEFDDATELESADMVRRMNEIAAVCGIATDAAWSSLPHGSGR